MALGFTPNRSLDLLADNNATNTAIARIDARDAISFAQMNFKHHYDRVHQPMNLKVGDFAVLRLHKGYSIPSTVGVTKKLTQQYVGPFRVLERVGRLAYRLNVPADWRIHNVFTIAQLEPAPDPATDPFQRPRPDHPNSVFVEGDTDSYKSFEIERLLNKRSTRRSGREKVQYLVRWKGYGPEFDRWYDEVELENARELIEVYEHEARGMRGPRRRH